MSQNKGSRSRWQRMSRAEGANLVQEWKQSGLGPKEFARARGVGLHRLDYWRRQVDSTTRVPFVVMSSEDLGSSPVLEKGSLDDDTIEISIGSRVVVRVRNTEASLAGVLRELGGLTS